MFINFSEIECLHWKETRKKSFSILFGVISFHSNSIVIFIATYKIDVTNISSNSAIHFKIEIVHSTNDEYCGNIY